jgi:MoaA/NifB/PqqE/SkfB family radical SAM enzyme
VQSENSLVALFGAIQRAGWLIETDPEGFFMATAPRFRIDVDIHNLLVRSSSQRPTPAMPAGLTLPQPIFPQHPAKLSDPGPETVPKSRDWTLPQAYRIMRGWLFPYVRSRVLPGEFHPITAYLFVEYKCNLDCWYCWAFDNRVKGMTEDVARRSIDWLHDHGCRVLALMGGEPLLRPQFAHKVVYYAAKKGFWIYIGTNARLLRPDVTDRLADAGASIFNFAVDAWDEKPSLPKALIPVERNLEYLLKKQYVYGYMVFFNMNICRNNMEDIRQLTEYARAHRIATDYHINETPMLEQDEHFKHLEENPTYIRPQDWPEIDRLVEWLIEKNKAGYQMVNSVQRLEEMKAFIRMSSGLDLRKTGWNGDGSSPVTPQQLAGMPGIVQADNGELHFAEWNCRAGQNNVIIRTDGTVAPCFPMYGATYDWGNIDEHKFDDRQLGEMKTTCQRHCFSTLNHNLAYCYNDSRVIKFVWTMMVKNRMKGGAQSFKD